MYVSHQSLKSSYISLSDAHILIHICYLLTYYYICMCVNRKSKLSTEIFTYLSVYNVFGHNTFVMFMYPFIVYRSD